MYFYVYFYVCMRYEFENYFQKSKFLGFKILKSNINFKENSPAKKHFYGMPLNLWMDKDTLIQLTNSIFIVKMNETCIAIVTKRKHKCMVLN